MVAKTDFREFARQDRYRAFEILLWWEGSCNASDLSALFNVRRENITKDIQAYRAEHGEHIVYDSLIKAYRPTAGFVPVYTAGLIAEYVDFRRRFRTAGPAISEAWLDSGPRPYVEPDPDLFRTLVRSIRSHTPLVIRYRSWNHPEGIERRIHPHALAYSGLRWHCRAFDEVTESYRDFHLGRFERYQQGEKASGLSGDGDADWHTWITVELEPNPALSPGERNLVRADYGLKGDTLLVRCRKAMALYVLQSYQLDPSFTEDTRVSPRMRPLVLKNRADFPVPLV